DANNWHSAAKTAGYATPGYVNSQFIQQNNSADELISLENKTFSPDGDGFKDFLLIHFNADQAGYLANIKIFDANGRLVKDFLHNELLGTSANFKWDGTTNEGIKARLGIYIIWIELFQPNGELRQLKRTCVVAGQLK
ncbi:MAG TPA: hypothetical protein ENK52_05755, partial [Saprospiraceae bacterium]|nr:hypothetical protein [Saprospiraceae bacterium]